MTNETFFSLTSTSVDWNFQSHTLNKIEMMASCVLTHRLTQPPATLQLQWLPWHLLRNHHCGIKLRVSSSLLCSPPFEHYKNPNEIGQRYAISRVFPISLSLRVLTHLKVWPRLRRVCLDNLSRHLYAGTTKAQSPASG